VSEFRSLGEGAHSPTQSHLSQLHLSRIDYFLATSAYAPATVAAYTAAVTRFQSYCRHHDRHASPLHFDHCVREYICLLFQHYNRRNRQLAVNTVYASTCCIPSCVISCVAASSC
jgi:uncharacterized protein YciW